MNRQHDNRFSTETHELLKRAGWFPSRDVFESVTLPKKFRIFPVAIKVLSEFGNLKIGESGPGIDVLNQLLFLSQNLLNMKMIALPNGQRKFIPLFTHLE
ncbi:MAG: SUKH-3 domain-containing protein [Caldilineaceae bacterium]